MERVLRVSDFSDRREEKEGWGRKFCAAGKGVAKRLVERDLKDAGGREGDSRSQESVLLPREKGG